MAFITEEEISKQLLACGFVIGDKRGLKFSAPKRPLRFTHADVKRGSIYATDDFLTGNGGFHDLQKRAALPPDDFGNKNEPIWRGKRVPSVLDAIAVKYSPHK